MNNFPEFDQKISQRQDFTDPESWIRTSNSSDVIRHFFEFLVFKTFQTFQNGTEKHKPKLDFNLESFPESFQHMQGFLSCWRRLRGKGSCAAGPACNIRGWSPYICIWPAMISCIFFFVIATRSSTSLSSGIVYCKLQIQSVIKFDLVCFQSTAEICTLAKDE